MHAAAVHALTAATLRAIFRPSRDSLRTDARPVFTFQRTDDRQFRSLIGAAGSRFRAIDRGFDNVRHIGSRFFTRTYLGAGKVEKTKKTQRTKPGFELMWSVNLILPGGSIHLSSHRSKIGMNGAQERSAAGDSMSDVLKEVEMSAVENRGEFSLLLSVKDVAKVLGVSVGTVWRLVSLGELPQPSAIGRCSRWHREDVEKFVTALRKPSQGVR